MVDCGTIIDAYARRDLDALRAQLASIPDTTTYVPVWLLVTPADYDSEDCVDLVRELATFTLDHDPVGVWSPGTPDVVRFFSGHKGLRDVGTRLVVRAYRQEEADRQSLLYDVFRALTKHDDFETVEALAAEIPDFVHTELQSCVESPRHTCPFSLVSFAHEHGWIRVTKSVARLAAFRYVAGVAQDASLFDWALRHCEAPLLFSDLVVPNIEQARAYVSMSTSGKDAKDEAVARFDSRVLHFLDLSLECGVDMWESGAQGVQFVAGYGTPAQFRTVLSQHPERLAGLVFTQSTGPLKHEEIFDQVAPKSCMSLMVKLAMSVLEKSSPKTDESPASGIQAQTLGAKLVAQCKGRHSMLMCLVELRERFPPGVLPTINIHEILIKACASDDVETVRACLRAGAYAEFNDGEPFQEACGNRSMGVIRELLPRVDVNRKKTWSLCRAVYAGYWDDVVPLLVAYGADIRVKDDFFLRRAVEAGRADMVRLAISRGANVYAKDGEALRGARSAGVIRELIERVRTAKDAVALALEYYSSEKDGVDDALFDRNCRGLPGDCADAVLITKRLWKRDEAGLCRHSRASVHDVVRSAGSDLCAFWNKDTPVVWAEFLELAFGFDLSKSADRILRFALASDRKIEWLRWLSRRTGPLRVTWSEWRQCIGADDDAGAIECIFDSHSALPAAERVDMAVEAVRQCLVVSAGPRVTRAAMSRLPADVRHSMLLETVERIPEEEEALPKWSRALEAFMEREPVRSVQNECRKRVAPVLLSRLEDTKLSRSESLSLTRAILRTLDHHALIPTLKLKELASEYAKPGLSHQELISTSKSMLRILRGFLSHNSPDTARVSAARARAD